MTLTVIPIVPPPMVFPLTSPATQPTTTTLTPPTAEPGGCAAHSDPATRSASGTRSVPGSGYGVLGVVGGLFLIACAGHAAVVHWGWASASTAWFCLAGCGFLLTTVLSHLVLCRSAAAPLVPLMVAMMVRLAGTFLVLGCLLAFSPLSRPEAVFNVLFWYITLTAADLVGVVRIR